jgi:hypothetical protein
MRIKATMLGIEFTSAAITPADAKIQAPAVEGDVIFANLFVNLSITLFIIGLVWF